MRKHGLVTLDAEDELRIAAEKAAAERIYEFWDEDGNPLDEYGEPILPPDEPQQEEESEEEKKLRFDRFSLSSSLETLIDQAFLKVVQLRRKFGLGWAGAELLHSETEKAQSKSEDILRQKIEVWLFLIQSPKLTTS